MQLLANVRNVVVSGKTAFSRNPTKPDFSHPARRLSPGQALAPLPIDRPSPAKNAR
jgi:hypothetical protein